MGFYGRAIRVFGRTLRISNTESVDWSLLPNDLLRLVLERLPFLSDYIRFSAVCRQWRSIQRETRHPVEPSWLVLCDKNNDDETRSFFSVSERKTHRLKLPELIGKRCIGSSHGWLITVDLNLQVHLLHPFSSTQITLPPPPPFVEHMVDAAPYSAEDLQDLTLWKAIMSCDPVSGREDCVVMAIHGREKLCFYRLRDKEWITINDPFLYYFDVIYYKNRFVGIATLTEAVVVSELGPRPKVTEFAPRLRSQLLSRTIANVYLVESMGDLLQVIRHRAEFTDAYNVIYHLTTSFEVFKLDEYTRNWVEMKSLGDKALFLGYGASVSLLARDYPGCKDNAIYFTDDLNFRDVNFGYEDLGIYNLSDGVVAPYYPSNAFHPALSPPLWLTPSL